MSLWYDFKRKSYATTGASSWLKNYIDYHFKLLSNRLSSHFNGIESRHTAAMIDYSDNLTLKEKVDNEAALCVTRSNELSTVIDAAVEDRNSKILLLQTSISENSNSINELIQFTNSLSSADATHSSRIDTLEQSQNSLSSSITNELSAVKNDIKNLEAESLNLNKKITAVNQEFSSLSDVLYEARILENSDYIEPYIYIENTVTITSDGGTLIFKAPCSSAGTGGVIVKKYTDTSSDIEISVDDTDFPWTLEEDVGMPFKKGDYVTVKIKDSEAHIESVAKTGYFESRILKLEKGIDDIRLALDNITELTNTLIDG